MKYFVTVSENEKDIYDNKEFVIENFYHVEKKENSSEIFRWSGFNFKIIPLVKSARTMVIDFSNFLSDKLFIFIENKTGVIQKEIKTKHSKDYLLCISLDQNEIFSFFVTPIIPDKTKDSRILGLIVKNIFYTDKEVEFIQLYEKNENDTSDKLIIEKINDGDIQPQILDFENKSLKIVPLNYDKKNFYFNSSIFVHKNQKLLISRHCSLMLEKVHLNKLKIFKLEDLNEINFNIVDEYEDEQYEDPRILSYKDKFYVSCASYIHGNYKQIHQKILVLDSNLNHINNIHPKYGNNGESIIKNTGIEKNWTFFIYEDKLMCIYKINPHTVVEFDWNGNLITEYISQNNINTFWKFGECRGGTNPILKDGYYHSFFHSNIFLKNGVKKYYMGYYKFESKPPFKIVKISSKPILSGIEYGERMMKNFDHMVVFPTGMTIVGDDFLVSLGINDEKTALIKINETDCA